MNSIFLKLIIGLNNAQTRIVHSVEKNNHFKLE